ncbi:MAG TPA: polysaccharide deacetylase family protein [Bacillales bacterium]|nr:polysaccharide deacetylase family protein [Bacillales bacterium]
MTSMKIMLTAVLACLFLFTFSTDPTYADTLEKPEAEVLVVYSTNEGKLNSKVRMLDVLLSHFTNNLTFKNAKNVRASDLEDIQYLFYFGTVETELPQRFRNISNSFEGTFVAIGANVEQLGKPFSFVNISTQVEIEQLLNVKKQKRVILPDSNLIYEVTMTEPAATISEALNDHNVYPLLVHRGSSYYFAHNRLNSSFATFLGISLHGIFHSSPDPVHPAYIRLEDVHPMADPEKLMKIGHFLYQKHIPYMIAVIPVFKDPKTHREYHFSDSPEVVKALQYMQSHGGSIIMHGYTHQYRKSETGEGFEFWDVKNNTPIFHAADEKDVKLSQKDFPDKQSYKAYLETLKKFEKKYIDKKLTKGIHELTIEKLYPLAFEAPHYAMSLEGYKRVSNYFSTYVGQLQISNEDWHNVRTSPYLTRPSFLNNMLLLPETIGYVPDDDSQAVERMINKANQQLIIQDGVIGGFYHPYLGMDPFRELIRKMEQIPKIKWINLKNINKTVKAPGVTIQSDSGKINVDSNLTFAPYKINKFGEKITGNIMWILVGASGAAVLLFILNILRISRQTRKSLKTKEMKSYGG